MLETLRAWLNGTRDYTMGVKLYCLAGDNEPLKTLLKKGKTDYNSKRLLQELWDICVDLKTELYGKTDDDEPATASTEEEQQADETQGYKPAKFSKTSAPPVEKLLEASNPILYEACRLEANKIYKETMNARAVLFAGVPSEMFEDPNKPDLVEQRRSACLQVVNGYNEASKLYDKADYVWEHGQLPGAEENAPAEDGEIPDHLVYQTMNNLRKNISKIKAREQTPDRIELLQKRNEELSKLEERWKSLK